MDIQFWLAMLVVVAAFGGTMFGIGCYVGIRSTQREEIIVRDALSVGTIRGRVR
jgi:hypothetical protein